MIKYLEKICVFGLLLMVAIVVVQIILRYFFLYSVSWSDELARILNIWIVFIAAYIVLVKNEHVRVDYFVNFLSLKWQEKVEFVTSIACGVFCCTLLISAARAMNKLATAKTAAMGMPMPLFFLPVLIGAILMTSFFILSVIKTLRGSSSQGQK